jgi:hypothetical protein
MAYTGGLMHHGRVQGPARMRTAALIAAAALVAGLTTMTGVGHAASSPPTPWDGTNPYNCVVQNAGTGTQVPDPGADPYCVSFDKTNQNVTQLGLLTFALNEPARTAAAVPKCFYFQEDHWRGSVIQSDGSTEVYEFIGHYFFNKATGDGGAWITDFNIANQTFDPTQIPGFPPQEGQYFGPGTGGVITHDDVPADPQCAALAAKEQVYAQTPAATPRCVAAGGQVDRRGIGPLALDAGEQVVRQEVGPPGQVKRGFLSYCVAGGGGLIVGQPGDRSGTFGAGGNAPTVLLATTSPSYTLLATAIHVGDKTSRMQRAFRKARASRTKIDGLRLWRVTNSIVALTRGGHVRYLAVYDRAAIRGAAALDGYLRRGA